ncbi:hypothetical protein BJV77DRAFT_714094 [Russula vinacea]|nr:hypothetical protein BJV77DRAFT_714094 [Russula vinacea]
MKYPTTYVSSNYPNPDRVRQMYANPGDIPELVAMLREPDGILIASLCKSLTYQPCSQSPDGAVEGHPRAFQQAFLGLPRANSLPSLFKAAILYLFAY